MIAYRMVKDREPSIHITAGVEAVGVSLMVKGEEAVRALMEECRRALDEAKAATGGQ